MSCSTIAFKFLVDIYVKTVAYNAAGQPVNDWEFSETLDCDFMPSRAEERLVGRQQNPLAYNIWVHGDLGITVDMQLRNLRDGTGSVIEEGPFNIVGVRKNRGWATVSHLTLNAQKILE